MKRRRITNELVEKAIQQQMPFYTLVGAERPDGEYINGSRFVFELNEERYNYPRKFVFADYTEEDERLDFKLEYPEGETKVIYGINLLNIIENVKDEMGKYTAFLDYYQSVEIIERCFRETFKESYLEKHKEHFEERARAIARSIHEQSANEEGKVWAATLYGRMERETTYEPIRHVEHHFAFMYPKYNKFDHSREKIDFGSVYNVILPLRNSAEFGGGVRRPCLIIGQSSNGFYYIVPLRHIKHEDMIDEEYYACDDQNGIPTYAVRGFVDIVEAGNIQDFVRKIDRDRYIKLCSLINRDNQVKTGIYNFSIGMGATSAEDILKAKSNEYDSNFTLPSEAFLFEVITKTLNREEMANGDALYQMEDSHYKYRVKVKEGEIEFRIPRLDGKERIIKFVQDQPIDVLSNAKALQKGEENISKLSPDKFLSTTWRIEMSKANPMFRYLLIKRLTSINHSVYLRTMNDNPENVDVSRLAEFIKNTLKKCGFTYDGDYEKLVTEGVDAIDLSKYYLTKSLFRPLDNNVYNTQTPAKYCVSSKDASDVAKASMINNDDIDDEDESESGI
ncbi:MAG: hypothetical protein IJY90_00105 [Clostridia bacterium]|nr:hypothetical protein [Clostridia bacterium]